MSAAEIESIAVVLMVAVSFAAVIAGGVIDSRKQRAKREQPPVTGYTGTERRAETMTKYVRPGKVRRFPDVYDFPKGCDL